LKFDSLFGFHLILSLAFIIMAQRETSLLHTAQREHRLLGTWQKQQLAEPAAHVNWKGGGHRMAMDGWELWEF
jgi:hypothetical protein